MDNHIGKSKEKKKLSVIKNTTDIVNRVVKRTDTGIVFYQKRSESLKDLGINGCDWLLIYKTPKNNESHLSLWKENKYSNGFTADAYKPNEARRCSMITIVKIPAKSGIWFTFDNSKNSKEEREKLIAAFKAELPKVLEKKKSKMSNIVSKC